MFVRVRRSLDKRSSKSGFITEITEKVIDASQLMHGIAIIIVGVLFMFSISSNK